MFLAPERILEIFCKTSVKLAGIHTMKVDWVQLLVVVGVNVIVVAVTVSVDIVVIDVVVIIDVLSGLT